MQHQVVGVDSTPRGRDDVAAAVAAADAMPIPAFVWRILPGMDIAAPRGRDFELVHINAAYTGETDIPADLFAGQTLDRILPERPASVVLSRYVEMLRLGEAYTYEEELDLSTGARWWRTTIAPIGDPAAPVGLVGAAIDITEDKVRAFAIEAELGAARRGLSELRVFSSMAAHDVRSPLATIVSLGEVLRDGFVDHADGKLQVVERISEVAEVALDQMDGLLRHASTFDMGPAKSETVDIGPACAEVAALADPSGRLQISHPKGRIVSDRVALQLLLRNLVSNAARHAQKRIDIAMEPGIGPDGSETGFTRWTVSDDGPGFPPGIDIFRESSVEQRARTAHGFGLIAVRYVVETRGGEVAICRSRFGEGAGVQFSLPASPAPAPKADALMH